MEVVPTADLDADIAAREAEGFRLDVIFPADAPRVAELSRGDELVRLEGPSPASSSPGEQRRDPVTITRGGAFGVGRAGMQYRDLVPDRLGGRFIASHIRIDEPGPVPDYVHHHAIAFQMIFCRRGRVQVVYEDQGPPFWMEAGDCVLQPPHIRHRVLASDDRCEVVEIAAPAEHPTHRDHDLELPTGLYKPDRDFGGQRFSFDRRADLSLHASAAGWTERRTGIADATDRVASVRSLRGDGDAVLDGSHEGAFLLVYVLEGAGELDVAGQTHSLSVDDSALVASGHAYRLRAGPEGIELLVVEVDARIDSELQRLAAAR